MNKLVVLVMFLGLVAAGCLGGGRAATPTPTQQATATATVQQQAPIKIGFMGPLTGDVANLGESARNGFQMAVDEINVKGGVDGRQIQAVFEDGKCDPQVATDAANKLVNIDHVPVIIGELCSGATLAAAPIVEQAKVVLLSYCSSNPAITDAGDYVFRDYISDAYQGKVAAEYMYNTTGKRKVAILASQDAWAIGLRDVFKARFEELGGKIVANEVFKHDATDVRTQLTKIKAANPDGVYLPAYTQGVSIGLKQARELGITVPMVGGDAADDPAIPQAVGAGAEGFVYVVPKTSKSAVAQAFNAAYKTKYNADPLICAAQAYDAMNIIAGIMKTQGTDSTKIKSALYDVQGFDGASGTVGFDENGDLKNPATEFKTYRNGTLAQLEEQG